MHLYLPITISFTVHLSRRAPVRLVSIHRRRVPDLWTYPLRRRIIPTKVSDLAGRRARGQGFCKKGRTRRCFLAPAWRPRSQLFPRSHLFSTTLPWYLAGFPSACQASRVLQTSVAVLCPVPSLALTYSGYSLPAWPFAPPHRVPCAAAQPQLILSSERHQGQAATSTPSPSLS